MTAESTRICAGPECGNVIDLTRPWAGKRIYCSPFCRSEAARARHLGTYASSPPSPKTRAQQIRAYFDLLIRLAEDAAGERRGDLFDRIERTMAMAEAEARRPVPCGVGWPS